MDFIIGIPARLGVRDTRLGHPQAMTTLVRTAEELGYWGILIPDHITSAGVHQGHISAGVHHRKEEEGGWGFPDPFSTLAYWAAITSRVRLMTRILVVPYRQPFATAHALATIDSLSGGRLVFGAGAGYDPVEFGHFGIPLDKRGEITDEYLDIILKLWENRSATYKGKHYQFENASLLVRPVQQPRPPLWIGGYGKRALRRAIRIGDAWTPTSWKYPRIEAKVRSSVSRQELAQDVAWAREERRKQGKPPLEIPLSCGAPIRILERSHRDGKRSRDAIQYFSAEGTPDELIEEFQLFRQAGATAFVIGFRGTAVDEWVRTAETFARRVIPALQ